MPVYNSEKYIEQSVRSILNQTYENFELIIVNDASTDGTATKLNIVNDPRTKILTNKANLGNYPSRNLGLKVARGEYLFVMDADDLALPHRIERQLSYMVNHPDVGIISTSFRRFGAGNNIVVNYPLDHESLKVYFLENNYCLHPGLCIRRRFFNSWDALLYNEQYQYASDYDFVSRNFRNFKICNIPEVLVEYRVHENQITSSKYPEQQEYADKIRVNYLSNIDLFPDDTEKEIHLSFMKRSYFRNFNMRDYLRWSNKIVHFNTYNPFFKNELLIRFLRNKLKVQARIRQQIIIQNEIEDLHSRHL
jgi:glycosyltransferase involved in cell wall biosynthesis